MIGVRCWSPIVARYRDHDIRRFFRGDAAFARPELYEYLEDEGYLIRHSLAGQCGAGAGD